MRKHLTQTWARLGILMLATITGSNYLVMKFVVSEMSPSSTIVWRFIFAILFLLPFIRKAEGINKKRLWLEGGGVGAILGVALIFLASALINAGSGETSFWVSSDAAFVPIIYYFISKKTPLRRTVIGTILAIIGLALLSIQSGFEFRQGSMLGIFSAISFAIWVVSLSQITNKYNSLSLGLVQVISAFLISLLFTLSIGALGIPSSLTSWIGCIYLGFIGTGFRFVAQSYLQRYVNATDTALIYLFEPVIAAILGYIFLSEQLSSEQIYGCVLILFGVSISQISSYREIEGLGQS